MQPQTAPTGFVDSAVDGIASLNWLDSVGLVLVLGMLILGAVRGLWWQMIRLLGLVAAVGIARALTPQLEPMLSSAMPEISTRITYGAVWLGIFLTGLAAATLFGVLGRKLLETMQLGMADRMGGALVGTATGLVIHIAVISALSQLAAPAWVSNNVGGTYSANILDVVARKWEIIVPPVAARELDVIFGGAKPNQAPINAPKAQENPPTEQPQSLVR